MKYNLGIHRTQKKLYFIYHDKQISFNYWQLMEYQSLKSSADQRDENKKWKLESMGIYNYKDPEIKQVLVYET